MLLRLLIFIILAVLVYRGLKSLMGPEAGKRPGPKREAGQIEDDMVQDPQCGIYFPRHQGVALRAQGRTLLFCSDKCKQDYLDKQKEV